jgi:hypothetical protein
MPDNRTVTEISQELNRLAGLIEADIKLNKQKDSKWNKHFAGTLLENKSI